MIHSDLPYDCWFDNFDWDLSYNKSCWENLDGFVQMVNSLEKEFIEKNGYVTCEFSSGKLKPEQVIILYESSERLKNSNSLWVSFFCETCESYNKNKPYHNMIKEIK
jgi:hypothetical protein